jgi:Tfp pilus assembly ATPase PilU
MVSNLRIADLIRENASEDIPDAIGEGSFFGMQTFTQALIQLVLTGQVDREVAADAATSRHDFLVALDYELKQQKFEVAEAARAASPEVSQPEDDEFGGLRVVPLG